MNNVPLSLRVERWTLDARHGGARPRRRRVERFLRTVANAQRSTLNVQLPIQKKR
jgi:hypothetical protein